MVDFGKKYLGRHQSNVGGTKVEDVLLPKNYFNIYKKNINIFSIFIYMHFYLILFHVFNSSFK
jgi:hypothetical protein